MFPLFPFVGRWISWCEFESSQFVGYLRVLGTAVLTSAMGWFSRPTVVRAVTVAVTVVLAGKSVAMYSLSVTISFTLIS
jgi:hypothetical protein